MKKSEKSYDTGLRIFKVLEVLLSQDVSKKELIEKLRDNPLFENVYTLEAYIKYFNTLEALGFEIVKDKNIYQLQNALFRVDLTDEEISALYNSVKYIKKLHNKSLEEKVKSTLLKIGKYTNKEIYKNLRHIINEFPAKIEESDNLVSSLESILYDEQLVTITYYRKSSVLETIVVQLKEIVEKKSGIYIIYYEPVSGKTKRIPVNSLVSIKQLPNKNPGVHMPNTTVFRLYGRLAVIYKLKSSERAIDFANECLTVSNENEDRDSLLKRLLKYGENCKIMKPKSAKDDFIKLVDDILENLERDVVN